MFDRELKRILGFLLCFLLFFYGALSVSLQIFPYQFLAPVLSAADILKKSADIDDYNQIIRWPKEAKFPSGVHVSDRIKNPEEHYLLYSSTHDTSVRLLNYSGEDLHSWTISFSDIWEDQKHIRHFSKLSDEYFYIRDFHLYENGDMLLMVSAGGVTPWGMGLVKIDKDSNLIWKYTGYPNNDFEVADDGKIYVIDHLIRENSTESFEIEVLPFLEDNILVLNEDGGFVKRISIIDAIDQSTYSDTLKQIPYSHQGDPTHSNSVKVIKKDIRSIPWMRRGNLVISVRNINVMVVIDPVSEKLVYAAPLKARMQHDIDVLGNGNLLVFDNQGSLTTGGYSRVFEFHPETQEIVWSYDPVGSEIEFESEFWGMQQRLDNGNTVIVNADSGQILEVNRNQEIVWDYRVPLLQPEDGIDYRAVVTTAEKVNGSRLEFLN